MDNRLIVDAITTNPVDLIGIASTLFVHLKGEHDNNDRLYERAMPYPRIQLRGKGSSSGTRANHVRFGPIVLKNS